MLPLNLPPQELKVVHNDDGSTNIWDFIRQKWVALTPEENVRQHFVHWLNTERGIPATHMANEVSINLNGLSRRCDTVIFDAALNPKIIVEYKAPSVPITRKVFEQICRYNLVLKVDYLIVSNGLKHYCVRMKYSENSFEFLPNIPFYEDIR